MRKVLIFLSMLIFLSSGVMATSDFNIFFKAGMGLSFFHTQGNFTEGTPEVEFRFMPYYTYGTGITFAGIGVGLTFLNFESPFTNKISKSMYSLILGGTTISYYQTNEEKLFDFSFTNKAERLLWRNKFFLDINIQTGFRYYRISRSVPSIYQIYFGFTFNPGYNIATVGGNQDFEE